MKRYLAFFVEKYYPTGGWCDLLGMYDDLEQARNALNERWSKEELVRHHFFGHIIDATTGKFVRTNIKFFDDVYSEELSESEAP